MAEEQPFKQGSLRAAAARARAGSTPTATNAPPVAKTGAPSPAVGQTNTQGGCTAQNAPRGQNNPSGKHHGKKRKGGKGKLPNTEGYITHACGHKRKLQAIVDRPCQHCVDEVCCINNRKRKEVLAARRAPKELERLAANGESPPTAEGVPALPGTKLKLGNDQNYRLPPGAYFESPTYSYTEEQGPRWVSRLFIPLENGEWLTLGPQWSTAIFQLLINLDKEWRRWRFARYGKLPTPPEEAQRSRKVVFAGDTIVDLPKPLPFELPPTAPVVVEAAAAEVRAAEEAIARQAKKEARADLSLTEVFAAMSVKNSKTK